MTDTLEPVPAQVSEGQDIESTSNHNDENNIDDPSDANFTAEDTFGLTKNSRSKSQVCHVCNATFARVNHLTRHMILHRNVLVHQCERCDKVSREILFLIFMYSLIDY